MYIAIKLLLKKSLKSFAFIFCSSIIFILLFNVFGSTCSFNSIFVKYEYNSSLQIPLGNIVFIEKEDFFFVLLEFKILSSFDECLNLLVLLSSEENKNFGSPSFFFSLYIIILEHIPTKFLNKTISFISSLNLLFLSLSDSTTIGANSTLFNPTYISEFIIFFFLLLLNLIKIQLVSVSNNWYKGSVELFIVNLLSISIFNLKFVLFLSLNLNSNRRNITFGYTALIYSLGNTLINSIMHKVSSKFNNFLLWSFGFSLFGMVILLSESPLKKK